MTFSGCRAATRLLERCFIPLDFKIYNVFVPKNVYSSYLIGLVYVPKHSRRTCCQSRYEWPYMHHKVIF